MVSTAFPAATDAGVEILKAGGNAVDAALAAAWALSVCEPSGSGLGGQTTILISFPDGKTVVLDGHSYAPAGVSLRTVSQKQQRWGYRACTIPSTPATLGAASERFGRLPLASVLEPAIRLAEEGFPVTKLLRLHIRWCRSTLENCPFVGQVFLHRGRPPSLASMFRQSKLARTLKKIAAQGTDDFYRGETARSIIKDMRQNGGLLEQDDLENFDMPIERQPLEAFYNGFRVVSVPPPGGGLQLLLGLKVLENLDVTGKDNGSAEWYESMALTINAIFREREHWPLNSEPIAPSLQRWLLSDERAAEIATSVRSEHYFFPMMIEEEPGETTHLCTVDEDGMAVALTQSIQSLFGAKVANEKLGFFYNNYLCTCPRYPHPYQLRSHAMPQSNVAPAFVYSKSAESKNDKLMLAMGAAGSRRIISSMLQAMTHLMNGGMSLQQAVDAPRIHPVLSGKVLLERRIADSKLTRELMKYFGTVQLKASRSHAMGAVQAIGRNRNGGWIGVADPRREGTAYGF